MYVDMFVKAYLRDFLKILGFYDTSFNDRHFFLAFSGTFHFAFMFFLFARIADVNCCCFTAAFRNISHKNV